MNATDGSPGTDGEQGIPGKIVRDRSSVEIFFIFF